MKRFFIFTVLMCILLIPSFPNSNKKIIPFGINGRIGFLNEDLKMITKETVDSIGYIFDMACIVHDKNNEKRRNRILFYNGDFLDYPYGGNVFWIGNDWIGINYYHFSNQEGTFEPIAYNMNAPSNIKLLQLNHKGDSCLYGDSLDFIVCRTDAGEQIQTSEGRLPWHNKTFHRIYGSVQDDLFVAETLDYEYLLLNTKGEILKKTNFTYLGSFYNGLAPGFKYPELIRGYYNTDLQLVFAVENFPEYPDNFVCDVLPVYIKDGKKYMFDAFDQKIAEDLDWALVDTKGNLRVRGIKAGKISNFSEDKVAVFVRNNNGEFEYQLIDTQGKIITQKLYDEIKDSINGYCMAKRDGIDYLISAEDGTEYKCEDFLK